VVKDRADQRTARVKLAMGVATMWFRPGADRGGDSRSKRARAAAKKNLLIGILRSASIDRRSHSTAPSS